MIELWLNEYGAWTTPEPGPGATKSHVGGRAVMCHTP
jgi:hypothetical protein